MGTRVLGLGLESDSSPVWRDSDLTRVRRPQGLGLDSDSRPTGLGLDSDSAMARLVTARRARVTAFSLSFKVLLASKFKITKPTSYT